MIGLVTRIADKCATLGTVLSAMGCAMCFPALAAIASAVGLGFLAQWEGVFVSALLPLLAAAVLLANAVGWFSHRQWTRSALGIIGPAMVLLVRYLFWHYGWRNGVLYIGLAIMLGVAVWDLVSPAHRRCAPKTDDFSSAKRIHP